MSFSLTDPVVASLLELSVREAKRGVRGANPLVGAVIADTSGQVVATGHHRGAGTPHAEADALSNLAAAQELASRRHKEQTPLDPALANPGPLDPATLTMFVTLEPCNHTGRTGPCSHAIVESGIGRVVYAVPDATDRASGGAAHLAANGVEVIAGESISEQWVADSRALNARWFRAQREARPFTSLHLAQTLDANIAAVDGTSQWITGDASRQHSHSIRARVDAIIVGTGTIFADNPQLTARDAGGELAPRQPLRVAMGHRDVPDTARIRGTGNFVQFHTHDPRELLSELKARGVDHAMIEGGSSIATAFLAADLVDEIWLYQAPKFLGRGRSALDDLGITSLSQALELELDDVDGPAVRQLGNDVLLHLTPRHEDK